MIKLSKIVCLEHALGKLSALASIETDEKKNSVMYDVCHTFSDYLYELYEDEYVENNYKTEKKECPL